MTKLLPVDYERYYSGERLYGDDFSPEQISTWFRDEEAGYFDLAASASNNPQEHYEYDALNVFNGYRHLQGQYFDKCLGIGVGSGRDLLPLATNVGSFYCVEPGAGWWKDRLHGRPAEFVAPQLNGHIDAHDERFDLAVCLGVLHHIPNVTAVLKEIHRTLAVGGLLVLREPIVTMGEWGSSRPGLTKNERGLPHHWLQSTLAKVGFSTINEQLCDFRPLYVAAQRLTGRSVYSSMLLVRIDAILSSLTAKNAKYHRTKAWDKIAPASVFGVYRKE